jgi:DNA primase
MAEELKQAAQQRLESVRAPQPKAVTEVERILLCALVLPEADSARQLAATELGTHPEWFAHMPSATVMEVLVMGPAPENPFDAAPDESSRALLASALQAAGESSVVSVQGALETLRERYLERRSQEIRIQMGEAQRRGDDEMLLRLMQEKLRLDRERSRG